jgi:hypothetical protein
VPEVGDGSGEEEPAADTGEPDKVQITATIEPVEGQQEAVGQLEETSPEQAPSVVEDTSATIEQLPGSADTIDTTDIPEPAYVSPQEQAVRKLEAFYGEYHAKPYCSPDGARKAVATAGELFEAGCVEEGVKLVDFIANPPNANSEEHDHYRFVLGMCWKSEWTHELIQAAQTNIGTELGGQLRDAAFRLVGEYGAHHWPGDDGFFVHNYARSADSVARTIERSPVDSWSRGSATRCAQRTYQRIAGDMFTYKSASVSAGMARTLLGIHNNPTALPVATGVTDKLFQRGVFGRIVEHIGLDGAALEQAWHTGYGNKDRDGNHIAGTLTPDQYRELNIKTIGIIEAISPGAAALLHDGLQLCNFARIDDDTLKDAVQLCTGKIDFSVRNGPVVLLVQDAQDHNGSAYSTRGRHAALSSELYRHDGILIPVEMRQPGSLDAIHDTLHRLSVPQVDLLILDQHGRSRSLTSAASPTGTLSTAEVRQMGRELRPLVRADGLGVMYPCNGANDLTDGTGRAFAEGLGVPVKASPDVTGVRDIGIEVRDGRITDTRVKFARTRDGAVFDGVVINP